MINQIVKNEVFIRGMLVGRYKLDNKTIAVICARSDNKEHSNYQYVAFFDELKEIVDGLKMNSRVVVTARAWIFRDKETNFVNIDNLRLRGTSIETSVEFSKRVLASVGVPIFGIRMIDCTRFSFNGSIRAISKTKNNKISLLLAVSEEEQDKFNLIPLMYAGRGEDDEARDRDIERVLQQYRKGQVVSVKGFISQRIIEPDPALVADGEHKPRREYKNTYYITTFLTGKLHPDFDELEE